MNLFCIPYAGGSAKIIFNAWQMSLPASIKVVPLELAGHGSRISEPLDHSIATAVADILKTIEQSLVNAPYAIYGHSMGSLLTYELVKAISKTGLPPPTALFISGRRPPHNVRKPRNIHLLSDALLLEEMKNLGGTPKSFFELKELINAFLPIFRNDYRLLERYQFAEPIHVTSADIIFFGSDKDEAITGPEVNEWDKYTSGTFIRKDFHGGHFFITEQRQVICNFIKNILEETTDHAIYASQQFG